jgi:hypothetical protein
MKMSNTRKAIGMLIVAALSLATTTVGSSSVYAKDHRVHSFLPRGTYARATSEEVRRAFGYPRSAEPWRYAYQLGYPLPRDLQRYDGYQHDRQIVGLND